MAAAARPEREFALLEANDVHQLTDAVRGLNMTLVRIEAKLAVFVEMQTAFIASVHREVAAIRELVELDDTAEFQPVKP